MKTRQFGRKGLFAEIGKKDIGAIGIKVQRNPRLKIRTMKY